MENMMNEQSAYTEGRSRTDFQHEPIATSKGQIRLLRLLKDLSHDGLLQCTLQTADLHSRPQYQGISYVWGPELPLRQIVLNGALYSIRRNLWQFLNEFRTDSANDGYLWIDQVAINQANTLERNQQVQIMGTIFSQADRVVCWLGRPDRRYATVKAALEQHQDDYDPGYRRRWQMCSMHSLQSKCPVCERQRLGRRPQLGGSQRLGRRQRLDGTGGTQFDIIGSPYWTRLWITQEFVLARDLILAFGHERLTEADIMEYCALLRSARFEDVAWRIRALLELRIPRARQGEYGLAWYELLSYIQLQGLQCTDSRDLVYGLLGLLQPSERVAVDYDMHSSELLGKILDRMVLTERKSPWREEKVVKNIASLVDRLDMPLRWQTWLRTGLKASSHIVSRLTVFYRFSDDLNELGLRRTRWPLEELASMTSAACTFLYTLQQARELVDYFNNMNFPLSLQQRLEPYLHSDGLLTEYSPPELPGADLGKLELRRMMEYEKLIVAILGHRPKENLLSTRLARFEYDDGH